MSNQKQSNEVVQQADEKVYTLVRPINFEGEEIKELNFDFDELSGNDLLMCSKLAAQIDPEGSMTAPVRAFSISYQIAVAAKAAGVVPELIHALKAVDFTQATQKAANFLMSGSV